MNLNQKILDFLKEKGKASIPHWGVFSLKKTSAKFDEKTSKLIPPGSIIVFEQNALADHSDFHDAESILTFQDWKKELTETKKLTLENIGIFTLDENDHWYFEGFSLEGFGHDSFGLSEVDVKPLSRNKKSSNALLWVILFAIPILGLAYVAYLKPDLFLGKKSEIQQQPKEQKAEKKRPIVSDSTQLNSKSDSLKKDSTKTTNSSTIK